jgi:hypothetical protein
VAVIAAFLLGGLVVSVAAQQQVEPGASEATHARSD